MRIKQLLLTPDRIIYEVIYKCMKHNKIIQLRSITFMCINRVAILKETYIFDIDPYKVYHLKRWS